MFATCKFLVIKAYFNLFLLVVDNKPILKGCSKVEEFIVPIGKLLHQVYPNLSLGHPSTFQFILNFITLSNGSHQMDSLRPSVLIEQCLLLWEQKLRKDRKAMDSPISTLSPSSDSMSIVHSPNPLASSTPALVQPDPPTQIQDQPKQTEQKRRRQRRWRSLSAPPFRNEKRSRAVHINPKSAFCSTPQLTKPSNHSKLDQTPIPQPLRLANPPMTLVETPAHPIGPINTKEILTKWKNPRFGFNRALVSAAGTSAEQSCSTNFDSFCPSLTNDIRFVKATRDIFDGLVVINQLDSKFIGSPTRSFSAQASYFKMQSPKQRMECYGFLINMLFTKGLDLNNFGSRPLGIVEVKN